MLLVFQITWIGRGGGADVVGLCRRMRVSVDNAFPLELNVVSQLRWDF